MALPMHEGGLLSVEDFERMIETGVFEKEDRLELIRGEIVEMAPIGDPHAACVRRLNRQFMVRLGDRAMVDIQNAVALRALRSRPQPDAALLRPRDDFYANGTPQPGDIVLVVEVSDSTLSRDRKKMRLYAEAGIPEAWLADLNSDTISAYRHPVDGQYQEVRTYRRGETISLEAFPDARFQVEDILG